MTYITKKVLVIVKTYPNLSKKYDRTVCTAGIDLEKNEWVRLFPMKFFELPFKKRPKKFDVIEIEVESTRDKFARKESFKVNDDTIKIIDHIDTKQNWEKRNKILFPLLKKSKEELEELYEKDHTSIGLIKPLKIIEFKIEPIESCREWEKDLVLGIQSTLFGEYKSPLDKIPYRFAYVFTCDDLDCKKPHDILIEDWELCQLYRAMLEKYNNEKIALEKVRHRYFEEFTTQKEVYLILGTESKWNNWLIIGVYYPKLNVS